jgi:hypothetical protein
MWFDLLLDVFESGLGPLSGRGLVLTFTAGAVAVALWTIWLRAPQGSPAVFALAICVVIGACGLFTSLLHLVRSSDRTLAGACAIANAAAVIAVFVMTVM